MVAIWLMDCSIQSSFGRSASAVEVDDHCVTPEETVTRHGIENDFDDILTTVFDRLSLRPDDIDSDHWFGSTTEEEVVFQPVCASTQMARNEPRKKVESSISSIGNKEPSSNPENAFNFDVDSFMPSGFESFDERTPPKMSTESSVPITTSEDVLNKNNPRSVKKTDKSDTNMQSTSPEQAEEQNIVVTDDNNPEKPTVRFSKSARSAKSGKNDINPIKVSKPSEAMKIGELKSFTFKTFSKSSAPSNPCSAVETESDYSFSRIAKTNLPDFQSVRPVETTESSNFEGQKEPGESEQKPGPSSGKEVKKGTLSESTNVQISNVPNESSSTLGSRIKNKLSRFAFTESELKSDDRGKSNGRSPSPKRFKSSEGKKDLLNLQNLALEDWGFGSISDDFDF